MPEIGRVVDNVDAYPDPNFHVDAVPDPYPDWHQNYADPHSDPTLSFTHVGKSEKIVRLVTALPVYYILSFLTVSNVP